MKVEMDGQWLDCARDDARIHTPQSWLKIDKQTLPEITQQKNAGQCNLKAI
jgi:hypothetical protein